MNIFGMFNIDDDRYMHFEGGADQEALQSEFQALADRDPIPSQFQALRRSGSIRVNRTYSQVIAERRMSQRQNELQQPGSDSNAQDPEQVPARGQDFTVNQRMQDMTENQRARIEQRRQQEAGHDQVVRRMNSEVEDYPEREGMLVVVEMVTQGRLSLCFIVLIIFKMIIQDGFYSYTTTMAEEAPTLYKLFRYNFYILVINAVMTATMNYIRMTRERLGCYFIIQLLYSLVVSVYAINFWITYSFSEESIKYFDPKLSEEHNRKFSKHQSLTFKFIMIFRAPLLLCCFCSCLLTCLVLFQKFSSNGAQDQNEFGLRRSATKFWKEHSRKFNMSEGDSEMCPICMLDFTEDDDQLIAELDCSKKHIFHVECIKEWVNKNPICPICREPVSI